MQEKSLPIIQDALDRFPLGSYMDKRIILVSQMIEFVENEYQLQTERLHAQWKLPLRIRIEQGKAIDRVWVKERLPKGNLKLECSHNLSKFREGDNLIIHKGHPGANPSFEAVLLDDQNTSLIVKPFLFEETPGRSIDNRSPWIVDEALIDMTSFYRSALEEKLPRSQIGRQVILPLLTGQLGSKDNLSRWNYADHELKNFGLNPSQFEAVTNAYASELFYLIQGPPGTGKTLVLAHIARLFAMKGLSVLVSGLSHRAINNALNKIHVLDPNLPIAKIGEKYQTSDLLVKNYEDYYEVPRLFGGIIGCTPFATLTPSMESVWFDVVLVDEASQVTLPLAIIAMLAGKRYVFLGDDRQLGPVTIGESEIGKLSIFEYLKDRGRETFLTTTYRMNRDLCSWPSKTFYNDDLKPDESVSEMRLNVSSSEFEYPYDCIFDPKNSIIFIDTDEVDSKNQSLIEAALICQLIRKLHDIGIEFSDLCVVTPFRAQAKAIKKLLRETFPELSLYNLRKLVVDTVERMQGQEREVVLVSLVTSDIAYAEKLAEFYYDPRRLNVTVTRARMKLIVVGCSLITHAHPENDTHREWVNILDDFISHANRFSASDFYGENIS